MVRLGLRSSIQLTTWQNWSVSVGDILLLKTQPDQSFPKSGRWEPDMSSFKINKFKNIHMHFLSFTLSSAVQQMIDKCSPSARHLHKPFLHLIWRAHLSLSCHRCNFGKAKKRVFWLNVRQEIVEGRQSYNQLSVTFAVSNTVKEVLINISSMLWLSMWCKEVACSDEPEENYHLNLQLPSTNFTLTDQACNFTVLLHSHS